MLHKNDETENTWENWLDAFHITERACKTEKLGYRSWIYPGTIAYIGLKYHNKKLTQEQLEWCVEASLYISTTAIPDYEPREPTLSIDQNHHDIDPALKSLPILLGFAVDELLVKKVKQSILNALICLNNENGTEQAVFEYIAKYLWEKQPDFAMQCFRFLIHFSPLSRPDRYSEEKSIFEQQYKDYRREVEKLLEQCIRHQITEITVFKIQVEISRVSHYLRKAFAFLPEEKVLEGELEVFYDTYLSTLVEATYAKENTQSWRDTSPENNMSFGQKNAALLFSLPEIQASSKLEKLLKTVFYPEQNKKITQRTIAFTWQMLDMIIVRQLRLPDNERFWMLWTILFHKLRESGKRYFIKRLLLSEANYGRADWQPLHGKEVFYENVIKTFGHTALEEVIKLLSGIGAKTLLPKGLIWLKNAIDRSENDKWINCSHNERLIQRAFYLHKKTIQENVDLLEVFIFLLDKMVDAGSSTSFFIREIVMSKMPNV